MRRRLHCALALYVATLCASAQRENSTHLIIHGAIEKEDYCTQTDGVHLLRLTVRFESSNQGPIPLIVPRIRRLVTSRLTSDQGAGYSSEWELTDLDRAPSTLYQPAAPDPGFFNTLQPGETRRGNAQMVIWRIQPVTSKQRRGIVLPGEYTMHLGINLGPKVSGDGPVPDSHWEQIGRLMLGIFPVEPIRLSVAEPSSSPCVGPPLILRRRPLFGWLRRAFQ